MTPRPPTYSTAKLDSLVCPVLVDSRELQSCLPSRLSLPRLPHVPDGRHPVIVEIWRVHDGLIEVGGLDAHRLWELAGGAAGLGFGGGAGAALGAAMGGAAGAANGAANGAALGMWLGPLGWWWGAAGGAAAGAAAGATVAAATGALYGARLAMDVGRTTSEINSRVIGTYNEIIVTVPCQCEQRGSVGDFAFVLGTYTDSAASMLGEWLVGWGFRKSQAFGERAKDGALEVNIGACGGPFRVVSRQAFPPVPLSAVRAPATHVLGTLSRPLLGMLPADRLMLSFMDRSFDDQTVRVSPVSVRLEWSDAFLTGIRGFASDIGAIGNGEPWGAFAVTGLPVRLSYPCAVDH